jgi:hypothetical protein
MNITPYHFKEITNKGYNLDIIYTLKLVEEGVDVKSFCEEAPKLKIVYQSIIRKGLISEQDCLTTDGKSLLKFLETPANEVVELIKQKPNSSDFDLWWKTYPSTDTFVIKGTNFLGSRSFKVKKDECKLKLQKILAEGEYTIEELVKALELDVFQKKENSFKTKTNKLSFLQNSLTYLNQRSFEGYIDLIRQGFSPKEEPEIVGSTDI